MAPIGKEGNVLFNDALNTFYLQLYGDMYMVKDHSKMNRTVNGKMRRLHQHAQVYSKCIKSVLKVLDQLILHITPGNFQIFRDKVY